MMKAVENISFSYKGQTEKVTKGYIVEWMGKFYLVPFKQKIERIFEVTDNKIKTVVSNCYPHWITVETNVMDEYTTYCAKIADDDLGMMQFLSDNNI